jgi:chemotaxis signal transduction protein
MHDEISVDALAQMPAYKLRRLKAGSSQVGVFEDQITTIADWNEPAPLPFAPESVLGVVCIQGRMFTVLNLAQLLGANEENETADLERRDSRRCIVALRGDEQLALAVDASQETFAVTAVDIRAPKELSLRLFLGTVEQSGEEVQVLDVKELFPAVIHRRERRRRRI